MARKMNALTLLKMTTALAAFGAASPLLAQAGDPPSPEEAEQVAAEQADDVEGADAALIGDEIVVTARRREETLQDVPISVSAFSGEALENQGAVDITALQQQTPNLTLQIARGSNSTLIAFIRGIGQQDPVWGYEPGVGLYIDDVYVARPQGAVLDIFDVERVEVLRGPQGTLYGRNTIGGAIKYVTRRLGSDFEGKVRVAYGSYDQVDLVGTVTVPLGPTLSVGGALAYYQRDGFGQNLSTGADHYNKDVWAGRLSMEFVPNDRIFVRVAADKTVDNSNPRHGHRELGNAFGPPFPGGPVFDPPESVYDTRAGVGDDNRVETQGISGTAEIGLSDTLTVKSITAYREGESDTVIDFDGTPGPILDIPAFYKDDQFTQELQLLYTGARIQGVAGVYYIDNSASGAFDTVIGNAGLTTLTSGEVKTNSIAAFADVSFDVTDQIAVSVGGRYTSDKREGTVFRQNYLGIRSPTFGNAAATPLGTPRTDYTNERTFNEFTPRLSVSYEPTEDLLIYASYSKGFKSGGFDPRGDAVLVPNTDEGYDPEEVNAYEIGVKGAFLNRRLFLNIAGFYSDYTNQQVTQQYLVGTTVASEVVNVGESTIKGVEVEGRAILTDALSATIAVGYTDAEFDTFVSFDPVTMTVRELADERNFQNTPKWNGNFTVNYVQYLGNGSSIAFTPAVSFRSSYNLFEIDNPLLDEDGYTLFDASIVWTSEDDRFQLGAHARNIGNERYRVGGYVFPGALLGNSLIGFYGPPRTFTISGQVKF